MNIAQPAVSQHVRALEQELNVALFIRGTRGMQLTEAGLALLGHARALLGQLADLQMAAERLNAGADRSVEIAATPSLAATLLPPALELLKTTSSPLRLVVYERTTMDCLALLAGRSVELAFVRDCESLGFDLERIASDPIVCVLSVDHSLGRKDGLILADLAEEPFVLFRQSGRERLYQAAITACLEAGFMPRTICEGAEILTMGRLVEAGLAVAVTPLSAVSLWHGPVRVLHLSDPDPRTTVFAAILPGHTLSESAMRLLQAVRRTVDRTALATHSAEA